MTQEEAIQRIQHVIENKLTELDISGCDLPTLRPKRLIDEAGKYVTTLNIADTGINPATIPLIAASFPLLTNLNVSSNNIGYEGGEEIANHFKRLTELNISNNNIGDEGAKEIAANLQGLRELNIRFNNIGNEGAKEIAANLKGLTHLYISNNNIGFEGAKEIAAHLKGLTNLFISTNSIGDEGAKEIAAHLKGLKHLFIRDNNIGDEGLKALALSGNLAGAFIHLGRNNAQSIPKDVARNIDALRSYFKSQLVNGNVLRIVLCGNTMAGKTSLAGKLKDKNTVNPSEKERTHGIKHWCVKPEESGRKFILNIWDFGGQDYYHATHAASLSSGDKEKDNELTMYLLVWWKGRPTNLLDEDRQQFEEDYWFGFIQLLAGKPDMMVVQTHTHPDTDRPAFPLSTLKESYFELAPGDYQYLTLGETYFHTEEGKRLWEQFKANLYREVERKLAASKEQVPVAWPELRKNAIPGIMKGKVTLTKEQFKNKLLASKDLKGSTDKERDLAYDALLPYLRGCGDILYWEEDGALKDMVVVNIEEFHKQIYEELLTKDVREVGAGELAATDKHAFHIAYLLHHELIFRKESDKEIYVAPQYLPEQKLANHFRDLIPLTLVLKYPHYMPRYLITRLIVRTYNKNKKTDYWKYGCISSWENGDSSTKFMVAINTEEQTVSFYIQDTRDKFELLRMLFGFFTSFGNDDLWKEETKERNLQDKMMVIEGEKKESKLSADVTDALQVSTGGKFVAMGELQKAIGARQLTVRDVEGNYTGIDVTMQQVANKDAPHNPKKIFFSYSRYDRQYREELDIHFAPMKREGLVASWYDGELDAGDDVHATIKKELENADIIICLLSPRFMANEYIWGVEMARAREMGKRIILITLIRCDYTRHFTDLFGSELQGFLREKQLREDEGQGNDATGATKKEDTVWIATERHGPTRDYYYGYIVSKVRGIIERG